MTINITSLLNTSATMQQAEQDATEQLKLGNYRAGNTGLYFPDEDKVVGQCGRKALARSSGGEGESHSRDKLVMFKGGKLNELVWLDDLRIAYDYAIVCEEEIPTQWLTDAGKRVTGRPDAVLLDHIEPDKGSPILGLELKNVSSLWTARVVLVTGMPKFDHLAQAAHYSWQLGVPFKICYTNYVKYYAPSWGTLGWPKEGELGSQYFEYDNKGKVKNLIPFTRIFDVRIDENTGKVMYRLEPGQLGDKVATLLSPEADRIQWQESIITIDGIKDYYNKLDDTSALPPRPLNLKPDGSKEQWKRCDYCHLSEHCDKYEHDRELWLKELQTVEGED